MVALSSEVSITTLANLQCPEVVFLAYRVLASPARNLPLEAPVAVVTQAARACLLLEIQRLLLQVRQNVDILTQHILIKAVVLQLSDVVHWSERVAEVRVLELFRAW
jgi:hypothetical protein